MTQSPTKPELIAGRFRVGDPSAIELVRKRVGRILAFRAYGVGPETRRDLEQTVLFQIWEALNQSGFDTCRFWGFVEIVTARRWIDYSRRCKETAALEYPLRIRDPRGNPLDELLQGERQKLAREALESLPESCQQLIRWHVAMGKSYAEIARLSGKTEANLRVTMHRCIKRAQESLEELAESRSDGRIESSV